MLISIEFTQLEVSNIFTHLLSTYNSTYLPHLPFFWRKED